MKITVTGGGGYIGSKLVPRALKAGHQVRVYDFLPDRTLPYAFHPDLDFIHGDLRDIRNVAKAIEGSSAIIHLAAIVSVGGKEPPQLIDEVNYKATSALVDLCQQQGIERFIFSSTCSNYGIASQLADETAPLNPTSPYAQSKVKAEQYILAAAGPHFQPTILRLGTVFGWAPHMSYSSLVNQLVLEAISGKRLVLHGATAWRPLAHIDLVVEAFLRTLETRQEVVAGQVFNIGSLNSRKIDIANAIQRCLPQTQIDLVAETAEPRDYKVSFEKAFRILGLMPQQSLEEGIQDMIDSLTRSLPLQPDNSQVMPRHG